MMLSGRVQHQGLSMNHLKGRGKHFRPSELRAQGIPNGLFFEEVWDGCFVSDSISSPTREGLWLLHLLLHSSR